MPDIFENDNSAELLGYNSFADQEQFVQEAALLIYGVVGLNVSLGFLFAIPVIECVLERLPYLHEEVGVDAQEFFSLENLKKEFMRLDKSSIVGMLEDFNLEG